MLTNALTAPFPWFGGKRRVAPIVWDYFGDVRNYVEPFAGSLAVLLGRPTEPKIETVNDLDCLISNFWRAIQAAPADVAVHADWPVNEADLHARHLWLVRHVHTDEWRERIKTDPDFFDAKVAGWWVWGISQWIGSGWCAAPKGQALEPVDRQRPNLQQSQGVQRGRGAAGKGTPRGVQTVVQKRPRVSTGGRGVVQKRPFLTNHGGGIGVHAPNRQSPPGDPWEKRPRLDRGGRGVIRQIPDLSAGGRSVHMRTDEPDPVEGLYAWFNALASRLRRVRVCCGDWTRVLGPAPTTCIGTTGVLLDPPYAVADRDDVYNEESRDVAHQVREWAIEHGDDPQMRIALCGYDGEHEMPASWSVVAWKANGGFGNQGEPQGRGAINAQRERVWFSPHCLRPHEGLFHEDLLYQVG